MNAKQYLRGMLGQGWYNFTECLAWPTPGTLHCRTCPNIFEPLHVAAFPKSYCSFDICTCIIKK